MRKYLISAAALICGIALMSCSDSSSDDVKLPEQPSVTTGNTTTYTETKVPNLDVHSYDRYILTPNSNFRKDIEGILTRANYTDAGLTLNYYEVIIHDSGNTDSYHKATCYILDKKIDGDITDTTDSVTGMAVYIRDSANKVKTLYEYSFDTPKTKAEADSNPGTAAIAYYETFNDDALKDTKTQCIYYPSRGNEISQWSETSYYTPTGTGDLLVEKTADYIPFNLKWDEASHTGVAIDPGLVTNGKVTFKNYKGEEFALDFPVINEESATYKRAITDTPYDFEVVKSNDLQPISSVTTNTTDKYQYTGTRYYFYDFTWNTAITTDTFIQQVCWDITSAGTGEINIYDTNTLKLGQRNSTLIMDFKKFGTETQSRITRYTWLNSELNTNYYRVYDYEPVTNPDGTDSKSEYYEYMYRLYRSDDSSSGPTQLSYIRESHQNYVDGKNQYDETCYSNESSGNSTGTSGGATDIDVILSDSRRICSDGRNEFKAAFTNEVPEFKTGHSIRLR